MLSRGAVVALACMSLTSGAAVPWLLPTPPGDRVVSVTTQERSLPQAGQQMAAAPAQDRTLEGVIALGDHVLLAARPCLESRGIRVHPQALDSADELEAAVEGLRRGYAAIFIHSGHAQGLVDGQIERVIQAVGARPRVIWSTIRVGGPQWGGFSFEERTNASIRNVVSRHAQGRVLDWDALTRKHPAWTVDGITMSAEGCRDYARKVAKLSGLPRKA